MQDLGDTVRGTGGFGSTRVKSGIDTGSNSEKNERTSEKNENEMVKNETLKGSDRNGSDRMKTDRNRKTTEGSSRLPRER